MRWLTILIPIELKDRFTAACKGNFETMSKALRRIIRNYVNEYESGVKENNCSK